MFRKKGTIGAASPEEKLLKIIEGPREKKSEKFPFDYNQKEFSKIGFTAWLKKINLLDLINRLLLAAGVAATVFLVLTIYKPAESPALTVIPREDINLLNSIETSHVFKTELDSYLNTILKRNMFELLQRQDELSGSSGEELNLKLVGIISIGEGKLQAIIEDKDARTYLANEGEILLEQIMVKKIEPNKVILKRGEEIIELK